MITQTLALLLDGYRELNAKKLFWITLLFSGLLVGVYACFGITEYGMTFLGMRVPIPMVNSKIYPPEVFYKMGFVDYGVGMWLAWGATILALVSTAPIFPDFLAGGAIELVLSKPISRVRLFLTKYFTGLLFVALQVSVFTLASFLVIGIRGGLWEFKVFLAIPIVLCFFSYLFCVCTLLGVLTRSTIASLLLTLLFWFFMWVFNAADAGTLMGRTYYEKEIQLITERLPRMEAAAAAMLDAQTPEEERKPGGPEKYTPEQLDAVNPILAKRRKDLAEARSMHERLVFWNDLTVNIKTFLPKTGETIYVLKRALISDEEIKRFRVELQNAPKPEQRRRNGEARRAEKNNEDDVRVSGDEVGIAVEDALSARSLAWVIGSSLGFEAVILALAAWRFGRRDF